MYVQIPNISETKTDDRNEIQITQQTIYLNSNHFIFEFKSNYDCLIIILNKLSTRI